MTAAIAFLILEEYCGTPLFRLITINRFYYELAHVKHSESL
jgi:hypothetical protein